MECSDKDYKTVRFSSTVVASVRNSTRAVPASCVPWSGISQTGSTKGCQGFRETKMRNGGRVILAFLNFYE
jgi:hypothetical protein